MIRVKAPKKSFISFNLGSPSIERVKWCTTLYSGINNNTALTTSTGLAPDILVPGENIDSLNSPMKAKDSTSLAVRKKFESLYIIYIMFIVHQLTKT